MNRGRSEPLDLKKSVEEHLPINRLVPSPFLCVHALDRERKGLVCVYASARILEFHYVTFSQVSAVRDYVSSCNSRLWNA